MLIDVVRSEGFGVSISNDTTKRYKRDSLIPTYHVGLDVLKVNPQSSGSVLVRRNEECWKKCFSSYLALSRNFQGELPYKEPFGNNGRIEVHGSSFRQLSHLWSKSGSQVCI